MQPWHIGLILPSTATLMALDSLVGLNQCHFQSAQLDPEWPVFTAENDMVMVLDTPACYAAPDSRKEYCVFWDDLGFHY